MKMVKQQKKGISLIVLVITIIVMIILAAAVILSLDGSNIIERAKTAQSSSDVATAKEIVALAKSEWAYEKVEGYDTFREYAEAKLEEAGFDMGNTYVEEDGRVLFGAAAQFAKAGVPVGAQVTGYKLTSGKESYTTDGKENMPKEIYDENGNQIGEEIGEQTINRDENITWIYAGIDEDGNALILGNLSSDDEKLYLTYSAYSWCRGPALMDKICNSIYSSSMGEARSIDVQDIINILEYEDLKYGYVSSNEYKTVDKAMSLGELANKLNWDMTKFSDAIQANKDSIMLDSYAFSGAKYNTAKSSLIFQSQTYWLASTQCFPLYESYGGSSLESDILFVQGNGITMNTFIDYSLCTDDVEIGYLGIEAALRPIVELSTNVSMAYSNGVVNLS